MRLAYFSSRFAVRSSSSPMASSAWWVGGLMITRSAPASRKDCTRAGSAGWPKTEMLMDAGVASDFACQRLNLPASLLYPGRGHAVGHPAIGPGYNAFQHIGGHAAQHDRRVGFLHWLGVDLDWREVIEPPVVLRLVFGPQLLEG